MYWLMLLLGFIAGLATTSWCASAREADCNALLDEVKRTQEYMRDMQVRCDNLVAENRRMKQELKALEKTA